MSVVGEVRKPCTDQAVVGIEWDMKNVIGGSDGALATY
jgi:hypothetical protein